MGKVMKRVPAFRLVPEPLDDESRNLPKFRWASPDVGTRHYLGGQPTMPVPEGNWPRCPDCQDKMSFYGQLDSLNDEFCIADVGIICVFICFQCNEVAAQIESP